jgi:hypothetical protein
VKKLNRMRFEQARQYMLHQARDLERALFRYEFEDGPFMDVGDSSVESRPSAAERTG